MYGQEACGGHLTECLQEPFACEAHSSRMGLTLRGPSLQAGPVVDAGGLFEYARQTGMIKAA